MPTMRRVSNLASTLVTADNDYRPRKDMYRPTVSSYRPLVNLPTLITDQDTSWREHAACKGSGLNFVPKRTSTPEEIEACKEVCSVCPVTAECLQMALEADDRFAICGGYTPKERAALKR